MQVILLENIPSLGKAGDLVKVSDGYGRNYLIPHKKAILATEKSLKMRGTPEAQVQQRMEKTKKDAGKLSSADRRLILHLCQDGRRKRKAFRLGHFDGYRELFEGKRNRGGSQEDRPGRTDQESGDVYCPDQTPSGSDRPSQGLGGSGVIFHERC